MEHLTAVLLFLCIVILLVIVFKLMQLQAFVDKLKQWEILHMDDIPEEMQKQTWPMQLMPVMTKKNEKWWIVLVFFLALAGMYISFWLGLLVGLLGGLVVYKTLHIKG